MNSPARTLLTVLATAVSAAALADGGAIRQRIELARGWNAIYLEATPDGDGSADAFFDGFTDAGGVPAVVAAGAYLSNAYSDTAQYGTDGGEVLQKPLSFHSWSRADGAGSSLANVRGGFTYLVCATNACARDVVGVPARVYQHWRNSGVTNVLANLVGVTTASNAVSATAYFSEGPAGPNAVFYQVSGTPDGGPKFLPANLFNSPKVKPGVGYGVTGAREADWPGVLDVTVDNGRALDIRPGSSVAAATVRNAGTVARTVRVGLVRSVRPDDAFAADLKIATNVVTGLDAFYDWTPFGETSHVDRTLQPDEAWTVKFTAEPKAAANAVVVFEDVSTPAAMRVRVPLEVTPTGVGEKGAYPVGLWTGRLTLDRVSNARTGAIEAAGGAVESLLLMRVGSDGAVELLQRVVNTNTLTRVSCVMMDPSQPHVPARAGGVFGESVTFSFVVGAASKVNPFRHPWHPDHDGVLSNYSGAAPSGDDLSNYAGNVKPETFSVTNTVSFAWASKDWTPGETLSGEVEWRLGGLTASGEIVTKGVFILQRANSDEEVNQ